MKLQAKILTDFLDAPSGSKIGILFPGQQVDATGNVQGAFSEIDPGGMLGWASTADLEPSQIGRIPLDQEKFVQNAIVVERSFNASSATIPWYISADYLIARGIIETGLENVGPKIEKSDAVGPLQVSPQEWKEFLANGGELAAVYRPFSPSHFDNYLTQIWGAGYRMFADAKAISAIKMSQVPPVGSASEPFLPSYLDVFHAYLFGPATAVALLDASKDVAGGGPAKKIDKVLTPPLAAAALSTLFLVRKQFIGAMASPNTVAEVTAATEVALNAALSRAFELIKQFAPGELPQGGGAAGSAPWLEVAKQAEKRKVKESSNAAEIKGYFAATNHGPVGAGAVPAWCGAFAAHCMKDSNSATAAASIPNDAALAVSWRAWGKGLPVGSKDIPEGAVVVLSPAPGTNTTGHVAFHSKFVDSGRQIELLGGNQTDAVNYTSYPISRIVDIRWLNVTPTSQGGGSSVLDLISTSDDVLTLARTIFGEARGEPNAGKEAVGHVVVNRVNSHRFADKVADVCLQPKQFSGFNVGDPNRPIILAEMLNSSNAAFQACITIAKQVVAGAIADNTGGATHYYARTIAPPSWTIGATLTAEIGVHRFFKNVQ